MARIRQKKVHFLMHFFFFVVLFFLLPRLNTKALYVVEALVSMET